MYYIAIKNYHFSITYQLQEINHFMIFIFIGDVIVHETAPVDVVTHCQSCNAALETCDTASLLCHLCSRASNIRRHRHASGQALSCQAEKMVVRSNRILRPVSVGDNVLIPIPNVDRGRGDPRNILCCVLEDKDGNYTLGTNYGTLNSQFARSQFTPTTFKGMSAENVKADITISVREAAREQSIGDGQGFTKCTCKTGCKTKACKCKKSGVLCNSRCHNSLSCKNK